MTKSSKSSGDKPRSKGKVRAKKSALTRSQKWVFEPKLKNEAIVLHSILNVYPVSFYEEIVNNIRGLVTSLIRNHGFTDGPNRYKIIQNYTIELIEYRDPENPGWLSTSEVHRVPSKLGINFIQLIVNYFGETDPAMQKKYYQVIITILSIPRIVEGLVDADFKSVTDKANSIEEAFLSDFSTYVDKKLEHLTYDIQKVNLSSYKVNFKKNGPNGLPKLESAEDEAVSLIKDKQLSKPFAIICQELKIAHLHSYVEALAAQVSATQDIATKSQESQTCLRKLVTVPDSGMKTRIVAIVDFWSQLALEPLRTHVQKVIRKLYNNTDFRMSQQRGVEAMVDFQKRCIAKEKIEDHTLDIQKLKFYDISSWTDRFHRDLQKVVMRKLFGPKLAQAWAQLTVHCSWQVGTTGRTVKYGQGQGMGTNGSFDVATLTDHLYINFMYEAIYNDKSFINSNCYGKVGDDLWIYDPEDRYPEMCKKINLPINFSKSKVFCKLGSVAEFCSRTFIDGVDTSRISPRIISRSTDFRYLPLLLSYCCSRGIQLNRESFTFLDNNVKDSEETYFDKLQPWIISVFTVSSDNFSHLTLDYLRAGNWCTDLTLKVIQDQATLYRIQTAISLISLDESYRDIEMLTSEVQDAEGELSMEDIFVLTLGKYDLFDLNSPISAKALSWYKTDNKVLTPKQIFVLGRFITQSKQVSDNFYKIYELDPYDSNYFVEAKELLEDICSRSNFDQGNVNYDQTSYISMQFKIVKVLQRMDSEFTQLNLKPAEVVTLSRITGEDILQSKLLNLTEQEDRERLRILLN